MKFLAVLLLAGFALASAIPVPSQQNAVDEVRELHETLLELAALEAEGDDEPKTELGKKLQEHLENLLEQIKKTLDHGKTVKEETLEKFKEIKEKLKELKIELGNHAKELIGKIKEKAKDYFKKLLDKLGMNKRSADYHAELFAEELAADDDEPKTELGKKLQEHLENLLEQIKKTLDHGKTVKEETLEKFKEIKEKLKELRIELGNHAKELIGKIKEKAKDYFKKLLDKLGMNKRSADYHAELFAEELAADEPQTELGKTLQEKFEKLVEKVKDIVEQGKVVKESYLEKLKEIREQLKDLKVDLSKKAKEALNRLKETTKDYWNKFLEHLKPDKRSFYETELLADDDDDEPKTELGKKLQKHLENLLEQIKETLDHGKTVKEETIEKFKEIKEKLKELRIELGKHAKELLGKIKEKAKDYFKTLLEKLGMNKRSADYHAALFAEELAAEEDVVSKLRERFEDLVKKMKDAIGNGKSFQDILEKLKEIRQKLKDMNVNLGENAKELLEKLKDKLKDYWENFKKNLGREDRSVAEADFNIREVFKKIKDMITSKIDPEELKAKIERLFGKGSELAEQFVNALKKGGEKAKKEMLRIIERVLGDKESKRSIKDVYEKVKNYFKDLNIELKEKFAKFGEWVKNEYGKALEKGKSKLDNVKKMAREFLDDTKKMSKDIAEEAREFFKEYKEDLGNLWEEVREKVKNVIKGD